MNRPEKGKSNQLSGGSLINKSRPLTLSAMMSALSVLLFLTYNIPVINIVAVFACALPVTYAGAKLGIRWSILSCISASAVIAMILGPLQAYWFIALFGIMGATTGSLLFLGHSPRNILIYGTVITSFFFLLGFYGIESALGLNEFGESMAQLMNVKSWIIEKMGQPAPKPDPAAFLAHINSAAAQRMPLPGFLKEPWFMVQRAIMADLVPCQEIAELLTKEIKNQGFIHLNNAWDAQIRLIFTVQHTILPALIQLRLPLGPIYPQFTEKSRRFAPLLDRIMHNISGQFGLLLNQLYSQKELEFEANITMVFKILANWLKLPLILSVLSTLPPLFINYWAAVFIFPRFGTVLRPLPPVFLWKAPPILAVITLFFQFASAWAQFNGHEIMANISQQISLLGLAFCFFCGMGIVAFYVNRLKLPGLFRLAGILISIFAYPFISILGLLDAVLDIRGTASIQGFPHGPALITKEELAKLKKQFPHSQQTWKK